jgi:hypothetical protein
MSGIEGTSHYLACVDAGVKHVLTSYYQILKKNDLDMIRRRKLKNPDMNFLIDSGAHSFLVDPFKFKSWSTVDYENYVKDYTKWVEKNREYIFGAVELDIDYCLNMNLAGNSNSSVGVSMIEGWQQKYFVPLEEKGIQIVYCWHNERKLEGWEEMCSKFAYVGLPGEMSSDSDFNKYMVVAQRYNTKVHGFGCSKHLDFRDIPWYTFDSLTWKTAEMYGCFIDWDEQEQAITFETDKAKRIFYRLKLKSLGFDADGIINDTNYKENTRYALYSMCQMANFYARKYADRLFYYDLRLPMPQAIHNWPINQLRTWWSRFRPKQLFKQHSDLKDDQIKDCLCALAAIQNGNKNWLTSHQSSVEFLRVYFPRLVDPLVPDLVVFQKELAQYIAPINAVIIKRTEPNHWIPGNNPPKQRELKELNLVDLEYNFDKLPIEVEDV